MLPDDVFLEIFDFYMIECFRQRFRQRIEGWEILAHVCRRWRTVVFQSPHRLNLRLLCTPNTATRATPDIWPPLPLIIQDFCGAFDLWRGTSSVDNIIAALERNDRIRQIDLRYLTSLRMGYVTDSAAIHKPFPELTDLQLAIYGEDEPGSMLPDSFLAGTAPLLRKLSLDGISYPGLPKLLLSATHLVGLSLHNIPPTGYIPPEAMATSLIALTNLESLRLRFRHPRPRTALEGRRLPPRPLTRSILPNFTNIWFKGSSEYFKEILARIDTPRLNSLYITFFNQIIFDTPQLF